MDRLGREKGRGRVKRVETAGAGNRERLTWIGAKAHATEIP